MASGDGSKREIQVLLVAYARQGHLNPMLRLGKHLSSKGLQVTIATTEVARERMLNSSSTASTRITLDSNTCIHLEFFSDGLSIDYDRKTNREHFMYCLSKYGHENLSALINKISDGGRRKFSCIINNPFVPWVADVAAEHGIPCAMLWIQPCSLYAIYYRFYNKLNVFPTSDNPHMTIQLPGLPLLLSEDLPSFILPSNPFGIYTKLLSEVFTGMEKLKWVLGNSFYELEKDAVESMSNLVPIRPIGPLIPSTLLDGESSEDIGVDMWKPDETCISWLDKKPNLSVIYVSLGSISILSAKQMEQLALGLKYSNQLFLWVVKPPEFSAQDGEGQLPTGFLEDIEGQGLVVPWCPQTEVLRHPAVSCFISHCGWNSTLETVACGVPIICFPQWTDQPTNAKLITDIYQTGIKLRPEQDGLVRKEEVERCIHEIMYGDKAEEFRKRGSELKEAARKAVADGGSSNHNIQMFVDELIAADDSSPHVL